MPAYYYSSVAGAYTLTGGINASATSLALDSVAGLPASTPYKVVVNPGETNEEIVKVTGVAGLSLTIVRGWDGTVAIDHAAGATVRHMVTAEDLTLSRTHEDSTAAHGATGAVVGTTNAQTLTNKDLSSPTNLLPTNLATLTGTQAFTNKDFSSGTNVFPTSLATLTGAQTLTNKVLNGANNTFSNIPQSAVTSLSTTLTSLDSRVTAVETATAPTATGSVTVTGASGWTLTVRDGVKAGKLATFTMRVTRTGADIGPGDTGNSLMCTLPAGWRPAQGVSGASGAFGGAATAWLETTGTIVYCASASGISNGNDVSFSFTYILA